MKLTTKLALSLCFALCLLSCKKDVTQTDVSYQPSEKYLTFKDYDELNEYVSAVPKMVNSTSAKISNPNFKSLYDHYLELQRKIEEKQENLEAIKEAIGKDSSYFYLSNDFRLHFKYVSELLSRYVSSDGLIKIGNCLMRYQGNKIYYTSTDYAALLKNDFSGQTSIKVLDCDGLLKDIQNANLSMKQRDAKTPPNKYESGGSTIRHFSERFQTGRRRFYMDLLEDFWIAPRSPQTEPATWVVGYKLYVKFSHQKSNGVWWSTVSSRTWLERIIYKGDFAHQDHSYASLFAQSGSFMRPTISADVWGPEYPAAEAQYYIISDIPVNNNNIMSGVTGTNTTFTINDANFKSFYIKATGEGGQPFWEKSYSNSN